MNKLSHNNGQTKLILTLTKILRVMFQKDNLEDIGFNVYYNYKDKTILIQLKEKN